MFEGPSKDDIETMALALLKESKAFDVFPTPVDQIVKYANLHFEGKIDLSKIEKSFLRTLSEKLSDKFFQAIGTVRGILDRSEKTIYLDLSQAPSRQTFVKLHEVGHHVLYWQGEILEHLENDMTLDPNTLEEFEAEANHFATCILFQMDRFEYEVKKLELGIKAPMHLAKFFGASVHATLRRYVEGSKNRCALLVLENVSKKGSVPKCSKKGFFASTKFSKSFGIIDIPNEFGFKWQFAQDYYLGKRYHERGEIMLLTEDGPVNFKYHFFNNNYNAFVFLFPLGETKTARTKIKVISGSL